MDAEETLRIVRDTLETVAEWGQYCTADNLWETSKQVTPEGIEMVCPLCEEIVCDDHCPLHGVREALTNSSESPA